MSGLFFSSGEGIQLLPFPPAEQEPSKRASFFDFERAKNYSFSVHNSAAQQPGAKNKEQKNQKYFDATLILAGSLRPAKYSLTIEARNYFARTFALADRAPALPGNRAPPLG